MSLRILIFLLFITSFLQQCNHEQGELFPALKDDKYGYINKDGYVVIAPIFQDAKEFKNGLARVNLNDKWGFINRSGDFVISPKYDTAEDFDSEEIFNSNQASVILDGKYYCIDLKGKIIKQDLGYSEGFAKVIFGKKIGFIDTSRSFVISPQFEEAGNFSNGLATVKIQNKYGYIDKQGKILIKPVFTFVGDFSEELAFVSINLDEKGLEQKMGFIDMSGKFHFILTQDKLKLQKSVHFLMTQCSPFSQGLSKVYSFIDKEMQYGLIDKYGKLILDIKYDYISDFFEGLALVEKSQKWGYINKTGKFVIEPKFDFATNFENGKAKVTYEGNDFIIDSLGRFVINH